ncbi:PIN domain nuclease, a component of toxin-antitoxin system (PIN domain) [Mesorhizobium albiziae]|uniref:PIN domain nuclease, a component of toxin-antitoxin system (PIN domain) n=1 Tax=Neomesorhizobium albiziae TaxID=335020 RepID=A0A1I4BZ43_9HYPH|nr:type II toxin-antitoxin system VapC family toxin [Mesorhizobium albiziae]GLS29607.1 twitching motility protein PilT [Mesorhizobium albiziae]SFK73457.1 PIN domain nuclease, a component of toxin-antitoxin system (PIN domain) [Mesorhizobium albiziae]
MNLLLDTHALLWLLLKDKRLPRETALAIVDRANTIFVSSISGFEIATKVSLGKLPGAEWISRAFVTLCVDFDFIELPVNNAHAVMAGEFRLVHKDPFDRVLAAQAIIEGFALVTDDREMEGLGAKRVWRG